MLSYGATRCAYYLEKGHSSDDYLSSTYYDAMRVFYQIADYTGDTRWLDCVGHARAVYRDAYVIPASYQVPGYWNFTTGLRMDWEVARETLSKSAVVGLSTHMYGSDDWPVGEFKSAIWSREIAYAILALLDAERVGERRRDRLAGLVDCALGHIDQWFISQTFRNPQGSDVPEASGQYYIQPFMVGLTAQALIRYWEATFDPRVLPAVRAAIDWLWNRAWVPSDQAFWYENWIPAPTYSFPPRPGEPDLSLLIAPAFAWVYDRTGDTTYRDRGDQVFAGGVKGAWLDGGKQFNQSYMWSFDYVRWRSGN